MRPPRSRTGFATSWFPPPIPFACSLLLALAVPLRAQDEAVVDATAGVLAAEDARRFDEPRLLNAARHREPVVRRYAALALGRMRNPAATPVLLELLSDADSTVRLDAAFALGLIGDRTAAAPLRELVLSAAADAERGPHLEAITALAKIGGPDGAGFFRDYLARWAGPGTGQLPPAVARALQEAWRLGPDGAPLAALEAFATASVAEVRAAAVYSLSRLRPARAAPILLTATADVDPYVRQLAAGALTRSYADSAGLDPSGVATRLGRLVEDGDPAVRINALRSLGTYADPGLAPLAAARVTDAEPNVRVQALATLGQLGGAEAHRSLKQHVQGGVFATRRQALLSLARVSRWDGLIAAARWITAADWERRMAGAEALGLVGGDTAEAWLEDLLADPDGRVAARAYQALIEADSDRADGVARRLLSHQDPAVRTLAARRIARAPARADVALLADAYERALEDPIPDARIAALRGIAALAEVGFSERVAVEEAFLDRFPTSQDYLVRRAAQEHFPPAALRWGPAAPIETGRSVGDYRDVARDIVRPAARRGPPPGVVLETERGRIEIELFAADAPLTVHALLQLVDQRYFDRGTWHRVVPNFVIQDGDPRGDGWGGPGFVLRDEVNRHRYHRGTVGMALSGPDTGGSQFFITMGPQPHLDGTYTVVGRVVDGMELVARVSQGERIRAVRRR